LFQFFYLCFIVLMNLMLRVLCLVLICHHVSFKVTQSMHLPMLSEDSVHELSFVSCVKISFYSFLHVLLSDLTDCDLSEEICFSLGLSGNLVMLELVLKFLLMKGSKDLVLGLSFKVSFICVLIVVAF
jgi:hypothetical protein